MAYIEPIESSLGFVEFIPTDSIAQVEATIDGRLLRLQLDTPRSSSSLARATGKARVSVEAIGNKLCVNIEFPRDARLVLPPSAPVQAPAEEEDEEDSSLVSSGSYSQSITNKSTRQEAEPAHDLQPSPPSLGTAKRSEMPLFEREAQRAIAQGDATEPVREPVARAGGAVLPVAMAGGSGAPAAGPSTQYSAVVDKLTADHEAMAMHRVSEDDARIKARRQEARIDEAAARHARPSATGEGIDFDRRKSIDNSRRPSVVQDPADPRPSTQLDDVEYTKDEELERVKGFWHKIFHRSKKKTGSQRNVVA